MQNQFNVDALQSMHNPDQFLVYTRNDDRAI